MKEVSAILVLIFIILLLNGLFRAFSGSSRLSPLASTSFKHSTSVGPPAATEARKFCSTEGEICRGAVLKPVPPAYIAEGGEQMTMELFQRNLFMCSELEGEGFMFRISFTWEIGDECMSKWKTGGPEVNAELVQRLALLVYETLEG